MPWALVDLMEDAVEKILSRRRRKNLGRLGPAGLVAAAGLHLALIAVAVVVPALSAEEARPLEIINVRIVPSQALGTPEPAPPTPQPVETEPEETLPEAEPEAEPEPEEAPPPEPDPEPEPERKVLPSETAEAEPEPERRPQRPTPERPAAEETASRERTQPPTPQPPATRQGSPEGNPAGTAATGTNMSAIGDPDFTYGYYLNRVLALIEANWRRPPTDGVALQVVVNFRIRRDGTVSELEVAEESGLASFDLAGLRAVQASSPLPPLPAGYRKDSLAIRLIVR